MKPDGGPAFPVNSEEWRLDKGMSLRDYFAAQAMMPLMRTVQRGGKTGPDADDDDFCWVAKRAYLIADAMLAERDK